MHQTSCAISSQCSRNTSRVRRQVFKSTLTIVNEDDSANTSAASIDAEEYVYDIYYKAEDDWSDDADVAKSRNIASLWVHPRDLTLLTSQSMV